jgi:hypothetical protein
MNWNLFGDDIIHSLRRIQLLILFLVSLRANVTQSQCGAWGYRGLLGDCLGRNYYQWFLFVFYIIGLSRLSIGAKLFFDEIVVEDDTIEDDLGDIGEDQPQIEDALWFNLLIEMYYIFNSRVVEHSHN